MSSHHPELLATHARLAYWALTRTGTHAQPVFVVTRDRWTIRVTFDGDTAGAAELLPPGAAAFVGIDMAEVGPWLKTSRAHAALHVVGDRVTVGGRAGTVVGFRLEERRPAAGPWRFRLAVVYDDGVDGDPFPGSAAPLDPAPATAGECGGWQCEDLGTVMCLVRKYGPAGGPLERKGLCPYHAKYGDRRVTVVRVLHQIPAQAVTAAADKSSPRWEVTQ